MKNVRDIIKQLVEITDNQVIFTGSFSDILKGYKSTPKDIDIVIKEKIPALSDIGEIKQLRKSPLFPHCERMFIKREELSLDIFLKDFGNWEDGNWENINYDGILVKVQTTKYQIEYLTFIIENSDNEFHKLKFGERVKQLKKWEDIKD